MTEEEYILMTDLAAVRGAIHMLGTTTEGANESIPTDERRQVFILLKEWESRMAERCRARLEE